MRGVVVRRMLCVCVNIYKYINVCACIYNINTHTNAFKYYVPTHLDVRALRLDELLVDVGPLPAHLVHVGVELGGAVAHLLMCFKIYIYIQCIIYIHT